MSVELKEKYNKIIREYGTKKWGDKRSKRKYIVVRPIFKHI